MACAPAALAASIAGDLLARLRSMDRQLDVARPRIRLKCLKLLWRRRVGVGKHRDMAGGGDQLTQYILPLAVELRREIGDPGDIAAGMRERGCEAFADEVVGGGQNRNALRRALRGSRCLSTCGQDRIDAGLDQLIGQPRSGRIIMIYGQSELADDDEVLAFDEAVSAQFVKQGRPSAPVPSNDADAIGSARCLRPSRGREQGRTAEHQHCAAR
jgi:hypothetical protein